ncbi:hypothetical protein ACV336_33030, partial [Pseudomonas aeruginosa]
MPPTFIQRTRTNSLESLLYFLDPQMPHAALLLPPSASPTWRSRPCPRARS